MERGKGRAGPHAGAQFVGTGKPADDGRHPVRESWTKRRLWNRAPSPLEVLLGTGLLNLGRWAQVVSECSPRPPGRSPGRGPLHPALMTELNRDLEQPEPENRLLSGAWLPEAPKMTALWAFCNGLCSPCFSTKKKVAEETEQRSRVLPLAGEESTSFMVSDTSASLLLC